jgi:uncharacterized membrane protein YedE/YeeE
MRHLTVLFAGALFGLGLLLSGMSQPAKVIGFLDFAGNWDPSLLFVMAGALAVYGTLYRFIVRRPAPVFAARFEIPQNRAITPRLLAGSAIFGIGWGLIGYCPGPALVGLGARVPSALVAVAGIALGMLLFALMERWWSSTGRDSRAQLPDTA